jgi:3-hydroxyacyl-CoA dehydrogenase
MGAGIAQFFLAIGYQVVLKDLSNDVMETAIASIRQRLGRKVQGGVRWIMNN